MRLSCPNCAAAYDVPDGMIAAGGQHVQCTACHTRWFARAPENRPKVLTEDQIIARLENWTGRPRRPRSTVAPAGPTPEPGRPEAVPDVAREIVAPETLAPAPALLEDPGPDFQWEGPEAAADAPAEPDPEAPQESEVPAPAASAPLLRAPRLSLDAARATPVALPAPEPRNRFGLGLLLSLVLAGGALALYVYADRITARLPATASVLEPYADFIDGGRTWVEDEILPLLAPEGPAGGF